MIQLAMEMPNRLGASNIGHPGIGHKGMPNIGYGIDKLIMVF
jgi:hypothetical protein